MWPGGMLGSSCPLWRGRNEGPLPESSSREAPAATLSRNRNEKGPRPTLNQPDITLLGNSGPLRHRRRQPSQICGSCRDYRRTESRQPNHVIAASHTPLWLA